MKETIGDRLEKLRLDKGLTRKEVYNITGISTQSIYRYEKDKSLSETMNLNMLAKLYEVTMDYILGDPLSYYNTLIIKCRDNKYYDEPYVPMFKYEECLGFNNDGKDIVPIDVSDRSQVERMFIESNAGAPVIINTKKEIDAYLACEGHGLIRLSLFKKYLYEFEKAYLVSLRNKKEVYC